MVNNQNISKYFFLLILLVVLLIGSVVGITYAVFTWSATKSVRSSSRLSTGAITCTFNEGSPIVINSAHPISDAVGKKLATDTIDGYTSGYFDSTLDCTCNGSCSGTYEIYLKDATTDNFIDTKYVKTYLTDGQDSNESQLNPVTTFSSLAVADTDSSGKKLYTEAFSSSFSKKFRLRIWIADTYPITKNAFKFKGKLYVSVSA